MAASFAAYASQYLNRQPQTGAATLSNSHPMFFSFSTEDGSRHGLDTDLDDFDDPHLRDSRASTAMHQSRPPNEEDEDPYLRLDEDEHLSSRQQQQAAPLITRDDNESVSSGSPKGWLAHLAASPSIHRPRIPSPAPSSSDSDPPPDLYAPGPSDQPQQPRSLSLTESLLPRDGRARPMDVFSLPDPRHTPRGRRKFNDSIWTSLWLSGVSICVLFSIVILFAAPQPDKKVPRTIVPYFTLLHTVPLLTILTFVSAAVAYVHIFLLQIFVRPVMIATSVFIPVTLLISSIWAFVGSFMYDGTDPTWGETVGLRLFSIIPLILAIYTGRRLLHLPQEIHTTSSTLTLTTHLLMANPFLLALSPVILLATLIASLPFLTLIFRLLLLGYATGSSSTGTSGWVWHLYGWVNWAITGTVAVWLWSWGVSRGVMRMTTASVIGAWYYADPSLPPPPPSSTHTIHSALFRASGPSLGTVALSALILTIIRMLTLFTLFLQRLPVYLPVRMVGIVTPAIRFMVGYIDGVTTALSRYALIYAGLTGDNFMGSARRSRALTTAVENNFRARERRRGFGKEPPLTLLTISPLTLTFPFALITYIFVAHTLNAPNEALGAAVLAGGVTALVGLFCVGLVKDTADTLYLCYCIDKDVGDRKREEVFIIFEPESNFSQQRPAGPGGRANIPSPQQARTPARPSQTPKGSNHPSPAQRLQGQQQRAPSQASTRAPLPQFASPQPTLPARTAPLAPPPPPLAEEDPDPFKSSFVEDEEEDPIGVTQPLHLRRDSRGGSASLGMSTSPRSIAAFKQPTFAHSRRPSDAPSAAAGVAGPSSLTGRSPPSNRMMTSAELNMKSHILDPSRRSAILSDSSDEEEDLEDGSAFESRVHGGRQQQSGMSYAVASEMEQGLSSNLMMMGSSSMGSQGASRRAEQARGQQGRGSAMMEESEDLFPGSGFFN